MSLIEVELQPEYRSLVSNIAKDFYIPLLNRAIMYKRSVGYFSSSSLIEISKGIFGLVKNNGHIQLVASPYLSSEDIEAIKTGYSNRDTIIKNALIKELKDPCDSFEADRLNILANLISYGVLDIKIAFIEDEKKLGMYHEKMGIIEDSEGNRVAFSGSLNESSTAMTLNYETIDVFCSWNGTNEEKRVNIKERAFESIWNDSEPNISIIDFPELNDEIIKKYKRNKIDFDNEMDEYYENDDNYEQVNYHFPKVPANFTFHDYQEQAINNWEKANYKGIFDMATGTGKTYTGLGALTHLSNQLNNNLAVIIVCPYQHLVEQWVEDIIKFNINPIIGYSASSQKNWRNLLSNAILDQKLQIEGKEFFCFICTNATFSSTYVQTQLQRISKECLLLVDEAHNFGAANLRKYLNPKYQYRLALSATLERHYDEEGTQALYDYFGNKCIEYTLERAIQENKLTRYKYYPVILELTFDELKDYINLTKQIIKTGLKIDKHGKTVLNEKGKILCLKRARIVAAAENKAESLRSAIKPYIDQSNILVYCGSASMDNNESENLDIWDDEVRQIDKITDLLGNKLNMKVSQYTSKESIEERQILKEEFSKGESLQALIAIKCLDEGVNIPSIKTAFILASTSNPKEYIQRRGRVLRLSEGKEFAEIFDFITLPQSLKDTVSLTREEVEMSVGLVRKELKRAFEFSNLADNKVESNLILEEIRNTFEIEEEIIDFKEEFDYYAK